jgi:hypothetical protein
MSPGRTRNAHAGATLWGGATLPWGGGLAGSVLLHQCWTSYGTVPRAGVEEIAQNGDIARSVCDDGRVVGTEGDRPSRLVRAALAVLAATALLAGCGTADEPDGAASVTYALDLHSGSQDADRPAVPVVGPLEPGAYAPAAFRPEMLFEVDDEWVLGHESSEDLLLYIGDPALPGSIYLFSIATETMVTPSPVAEPASVAPPSEPFPEDYEAWLRAVPHIDVGPRRTVEIGGADGFALDVDLGGLPPGECMKADDLQQCFFPVELRAFSAAPGASEVTIHVVGVDGTTVLVFTDGRYRDEAASVLESIRWEALG